METFQKPNKDKKQIADDILQAVRTSTQQLLFIDVRSGTGKIFFYKTLCHIFRGQDLVVPNVAWTGIVANLLLGGRTSPCLFKLMVHILVISFPSIQLVLNKTYVLRRPLLIIWDEISMILKHALGILDQHIRDIINHNAQI